MIATLRAGGLGADDAADGLGRAGHRDESCALRCPGIMDWAERQLEAGRAATCLDEDYPARWLATLVDVAPPALWRVAFGSPTSFDVGIVGSRDVEPEVHRFCAAVAREAVRLGGRVVSGGAMGCDSAALSAAAEAGGETLTLTPFGVEWVEAGPVPGRVVMSLAERSEGFSRGRAMERNALIYAASRVCVVGQVRFRSGGTWHGATEALRRGLCPILVRKPEKDDPEEAVRGSKALVALGARYLERPRQLDEALIGFEGAGDLFGFRGMRAG